MGHIGRINGQNKMHTAIQFYHSPACMRGMSWEACPGKPPCAAETAPEPRGGSACRGAEAGPVPIL